MTTDSGSNVLNVVKLMNEANQTNQDIQDPICEAEEEEKIIDDPVRNIVLRMPKNIQRQKRWKKICASKNGMTLE